MDNWLTHKRWFTSALTALFLIISLVVPVAHAGTVGTQTLAASQGAEQAREQVRSVLQRDEVRAQLVAYGVDPQEAERRVAALSDAEAERLASRVEALPAGGSSSLIGAAVFIFVVLLITDILGFTDVFPFVTKTAR